MLFPPLPCRRRGSTQRRPFHLIRHLPSNLKWLSATIVAVSHKSAHEFNAVLVLPGPPQQDQILIELRAALPVIFPTEILRRT